MSIRHFSNRPCPECRTDTRHFIWKCTACGRDNTPRDVRSYFGKADTPQKRTKLRLNTKRINDARRAHALRAGTRPRDEKDTP